MDQVSGQQGGATLGEYAGAFRRRWWVVALGAVLGLALAAAYLLIAPKTYIATAAVLVNPVGGSADNAVVDARTNSEINLDTEAQLVTSQAVSAQAKVLLQSPEIVGQLVQHVTVQVPPNTNVLRISFSANTPAEAQQGASAYAKGYLKNRYESATDSLEQQQNAIKQQIKELEVQLQAATPEEREGIQTSLQALRLRLGQIIGTDVDAGKVISEALLPRRPASPNSALVLASGLAFGLLIGLAGLYLLERRDGRCYDWRTVERRLGLAILADVPGQQGEPAPLFEPHSPGAEAFGELRNALMTGLGDEAATIVVTTPSAGYGADVVVANLALTLARAGNSTTIVVADEDSQIPVLLGLPSTEGLTEVLSGRVELSRSLQTLPDLPLVRVLTSGHGLRTEVLDLEGSGTNDVLEALSERSHYVIVRTRPNDVAADAQYFGRYSNAAIPVIELGRTVRDAVSAGVRQWRLVGTTVPGAVTVPAFDAPEPAPPRAIASTAADKDPKPKPALPSRGPANDTANDTAKDSAKDSSKDSVNDSAKDSSKGSVRPTLSPPSPPDKSTDSVSSRDASEPPYRSTRAQRDDGRDDRGNSDPLRKAPPQR